MLERMDFDIGTLIYIVITLVAVVAGAFGKKKKPGAAPGGTGGSAASGTFFSKLEEQFQGFMGEQEQPRAEEAMNEWEEDASTEVLAEEMTPEPVASTEFIPSKSSFEQEPFLDVLPEESEYAEFEGVYDPDAIENSELISSEGERTVPLEIIELEESVHADYFQIVKDFDLSTAVIYSAIISRPDY